MPTVYIALKEGQNKLIVDGSLQLLSRLLETIGVHAKPTALEGDNQTSGDAAESTEVSHAPAH